MTQLSAQFIRQLSPTVVVEAHVELPLDSARFTILFGPSGSGKTTLLRSLAGLDLPASGSIRFGSETWFDSHKGLHVSPQRRQVGFLFQQGSLFPFLTARDNIRFGIKHLPRAEQRKRIDQLLDSLELRGLDHRYPSQLSGGEQQRVALARSLAPLPRLLLLDEPFSSLDEPTRTFVRQKLRTWLEPFCVPVIMVTHDRTEAISLGDRMVVMGKGKTLQSGPMLDVLRKPASRAVARMVGIETIESGHIVAMGDGVVTAALGSAQIRAAWPVDEPPPSVGDAVYACIRGEEVLLETGNLAATSARNRLAGKVAFIRVEGAILHVGVDVGFTLTALLTRSALEEMRLEVGSDVFALIKAHGIHLIPRA